MNAQTKRFVQMIRDANEPNTVVRDMLTACLQHIEDLREDDPGDDEPAAAHRIERLEANLNMVLADL